MTVAAFAPPAAAIAAHRFGLGEPDLRPLAADPRAWLLAQIGPADAAVGPSLASGAEALRTHYDFLRRFATAASAPGMAGGETRNVEQRFVDHFRALVEADVRSRLVTAATSRRPWAERLALFWANHFTVSGAKASARGLAGSFEREAIRPNLAGRFENLLRSAVTHPAMLRYLDNELSAGPHSRLVQRRQRRASEGERAPRVTGLNENLAREVLELHTLGAAAAREGIYTQADVTALAAVLTGWRAPVAPLLTGTLAPGESPTRFDPQWHEPGDKTVLGRRVLEGAEGLGQVLAALARHPATARHVCTKLARHVVADEPPAPLVDRLVAAWQRSDGELSQVYRALVEDPAAWEPTARKLKTPEEFVIGTARLLGLGERAFERAADGGIATLGQRVHAAPSPAGWADRAEEWLGPDAVWKRIEWTSRVAERLGRTIDARRLAPDALGTWWTPASQRQIERAADGPQALALLLLSPEFQRR